MMEADVKEASAGSGVGVEHLKLQTENKSPVHQRHCRKWKGARCPRLGQNNEANLSRKLSQFPIEF